MSGGDPGHRVAPDTLSAEMWEWYRIGLCAGVGVGIGVLLTGLLGGRRTLGVVLAAVAAAAAGAGIGYALDGWQEAVAGGLGGLIGVFSSVGIVRGALKRGGTAGGTAFLVGVGGLALAALALVPFVGYAEAVLVPALGARLRGRQDERYAGLRILARD
jgi:hypothetical protein